jgi:membrane peptidoglycan carboxypeptidase
VSPAVANTAAFAMAGVFKGGTAARSNPGDGTTYIGKTGTTDNAVHVWLVGSSTRVSTAVWVGNIQGKQSLRQISVNGTQAALLRHVIFKPIAQAVDRFYPGGAFPEPDPSLLKGNPMFVPEVAGQSMEAARAQIELAELEFADGGQIDSDLPVGTAVRSDPPAGSSVPRGTTVVVYSSNGQAQALPDVTNKDVVVAKTELNDAGWTNVVGACETSLTPSQKVYQTDPAPGTLVNKAAIITLHYSGVPACPVN